MRLWRALATAAAIGSVAAAALVACTGDDPAVVFTVLPDGGGTSGAVPEAAPTPDVADTGSVEIVPPDAGASDPCIDPGFHDGGVLCDDFSGNAIEAFWTKKVSADSGTLDIFADDTAPSPPGALRAKLAETDLSARVAYLVYAGPAGYTSVSCAFALDQAVGAGTSVRLIQILLRRHGDNARELTAVVDTRDGGARLDMLVTEVGDTNVIKHAPAEVPVADGWSTLELGLTTNHASASYRGATILDLAIPPGDFDDTAIEVGVTSFDPTGTRASSVRFDNLRCRFAPP